MVYKVNSPEKIRKNKGCEIEMGKPLERVGRKATEGLPGEPSTSFGFGKLIFATNDASILAGMNGLYSNFNAGSEFDDILVEDPSTGNVLIWDDFNGGDFSGWSIVDEGTRCAPSNWSAANGTLVQSSNIGSSRVRKNDFSCFDGLT